MLDQSKINRNFGSLEWVTKSRRMPQLERDNYCQKI